MCLAFNPFLKQRKFAKCIEDVMYKCRTLNVQQTFIHNFLYEDTENNLNGIQSHKDSKCSIIYVQPVMSLSCYLFASIC